MRTRLVVALLISACGTPPTTTPRPRDAGTDAGLVSAADGGEGDAGVALPETPRGQWAWVPIDGSECGAGARAGLGLNRGASEEDLFLFLQGGGACWNTGTCRPSLQQFGPLCDYAQTCLVDAAGGQKPTAVSVSHPDPYPADGGGAFVSELAQLGRSAVFDRTRTDSPFRHASFVYVPYCTGDLHAGASRQQYLVKAGLFDAPVAVTMRFSGAKNMDAYLARLVASFPRVKRVWLTGASGGAFGATLNLERVQRAFPGAEVHLLSDSGPSVPTVHWAQWTSEWNLRLPEGCTDCLDGGLPAVFEHLAAQRRDRRLGLLSYEQDAVIAWFFYAPPGAASFLSPPTGTFNGHLETLLRRYDAHPNAGYFVLPGREHVLFAGYGVVLADGGLSAPLIVPDGGVTLRAWIDAWATGADGGWKSAR